MTASHLAFLENTARDYDMTLEQIISIDKKSSGDDFYDKLEEFIRARVNNK